MSGRLDEPAHNETPLELTIGFMSDSSGCFDPKHYHSFQSVSFLLPRSCAGCGQRLNPVVFGGLSTRQVVQCVSCGVFAHRNCAFSKQIDWKEYCSVNYKTAAKDKEATLDQNQGEGVDRINSEGGPNEKKKNTISGEDGTAKSAFTFLPFGNRNNAIVHEEVLNATSLLDAELNDDNQSGAIARMIGSSSSQGSEESACERQNNRDSIFRENTALDGESADGAIDSNLTTQRGANQGISVAASEDGVLDGGRPRKPSKANFPFLSASELLPSYKRRTIKELGDGNTVSGSVRSVDKMIKRAKTWTGPGNNIKGQEIRKDVLQNPSMIERGASVSLREGEPSDACTTTLEWTENGPPAHWASQQSLGEIFPRRETEKDSSGELERKPNADGPMHFASQPFASVSRALQENITAHFRPVVERYLIKDEDQDDSSPVKVNSETMVNAQGTEGSLEASPNKQELAITKRKSTNPETTSECEVKELLKESKPKAEALTTKKKIGLVTVAGGIAGGVAGLMFAGPVGWVIGTKAGQTAGMLGLILDGSVTIGVFASGVAAGKYTGEQLEEKLKQNRVLSLGEDGTHRRLLLIRPSITTDPEWKEIYKQARQSFQRGFIFNILPNEANAAKRERYEREVDIVTTGEDEIPTSDKVLLLASRILNNRESLPGHVYRYLLEQLRERADGRGPLSELLQRKGEITERDELDNGAKDTADPILLHRARRQDAHAVIKWVTAALLEVRPGFGVSPTITELTATAVEGLVFGEIYDLVIEEIEAEYDSQDNDLLEKIADFDRRQVASDDDGERYKTCVSELALEALHNLPEAHSAVDKLRYCVLFLERISEFFSASSEKKSRSMGADSLLKMVCQHILVANVFAINAQVAFLEEFARDEQLLRGKEGYALVTLQASLHFLNASDDFENDIFGQDDY